MTFHFQNGVISAIGKGGNPDVMAEVTEVSCILVTICIQLMLFLWPFSLATTLMISYLPMKFLE